MKKKIYVKPCVEVIVINALCDTKAPYMGVASKIDVDAGEASAKRNNFDESENEDNGVRNFNLWDEDE
ncbi:hypothetical protein [uncultured Prevotella sp.]|uniref:hypothetical protein n=1 Tax=uncultured Prevotella sp. TaxID=159272 RepID=UPI0025919988|nr:hypothetical protein [uncultured Prevotella sp.]